MIKCVHHSTYCELLVSVPARLPQPCTVRHLVEQYLDVAAVPRRSFFELLSAFSTNELEREKLVEFSSTAGQDEMFSYCSRPRRTALEVTNHSQAPPDITGGGLHPVVVFVYRCWQTSLRQQLSSKWTTCWICSRRSSLAPSPSPRRFR